MLPYLESKIKSAVVDPRQFKTDDEYLYAQKIAWAYGQAFTDLLNLIDSKVTDSVYLAEKERGEHKDKIREEMN